METLTNTIDNITRNHFAQIAGVILGVITYLVEPTAAFYALWIAVAMDLITRIIAQSAKYGGFFQATKDRHIRSNDMFRGTAIKIVAYFFMLVLAHQSKYIVAIEAVPVVFSSIIYCILFLVEVHSIIENLVDAGAEDLKPLLLRFQQEKKNAINAAGDVMSDIAQQDKEDDSK